MSFAPSKFVNQASSDMVKTYTVPDIRDTDRKRKLSFDYDRLINNNNIVSDQDLQDATERIFGLDNSNTLDDQPLEIIRKKTNKSDSPRKSPIKDRHGSISKGRTPSSQSLIQFEELENGMLGQESIVIDIDQNPRENEEPVVTYESFQPYNDEQNQFASILEAPNTDILQPPGSIDTVHTESNIDNQGECLSDVIGYNSTEGIIYTMDSRKSWRFISQLRGSSKKDVNIVGVALLDNEEVIYKVPRLPSYTIYSEHRVCKVLQETLPSIKHFSRSMFITKMALKCDRRNLCLPSYPNGATGEPWRSCDVLIQKMVPGISLAQHIDMEASYGKLFSAIYQILGVLRVVQTWLQYTHYDLHPNNIKLKPTKEGTYFLFDALADNQEPFATYSHGFKAVIIDQEFAHVCTMDGYPLDSFMGHLVRSFDPTSYDPSIDVLRFLISTFGYYHCKHKNGPFIGKLANSLIKRVNGYGHGVINGQDGVINDEGVFQYGHVEQVGPKNEETFIPIEDPIYKGINQHFSQTDEEKGFVNRWLYHIVGLLTHRIRLPLEKRVENPDTMHLLEVIKLLILLKCQQKEHRLRVLYELMSGKDNVEVYNVVVQLKISISDFNVWIASVRNAIEKCLPHLETALYFTSLENKNIRTQQHTDDFTPEKMIRWLNTKYILRRPVDNSSTICWMTKSARYKISMKSCTPETLNYINCAKDMFDFAKRLKEAVQTIQRFQ